MVLASNRPEDLDAAVLDRIDDTIHFPLPGEANGLSRTVLRGDLRDAVSGRLSCYLAMICSPLRAEGEGGDDQALLHQVYRQRGRDGQGSGQGDATREGMDARNACSESRRVFVLVETPPCGSARQFRQGNVERHIVVMLAFRPV